MAEVFKPIFSDFWLNVFTWFFVILAVGTLVWFVLYIKNSKNQKSSTTISVMIVVSFAVAFALQFLLTKNEINLS
ncbi:MAG: hypothetical protein GPJ54_00760 [Candidatus Heimdallarchaeota archaeon]|nr:hypothetical protein [Candidatus Heimdallarchaeota archaeon]